MDGMEMFELEEAETDFDDLNHNLQLCCTALTHDGVRKDGRASVRSHALRVLLIGDEPIAIDEFVSLVHRWGHEARAAYDGPTALREAAAQRPDVVLLKMEMSFSNQCQVARQLRSYFPNHNCFIIALTARATADRRQQCQAAGIDLLLIRPVDPAVVETLLMLESVLVNRSWVESMTGFANHEQF